MWAGGGIGAPWTVPVAGGIGPDCAKAGSEQTATVAAEMTIAAFIVFDLRLSRDEIFNG